jgi:hypothetical protein
LQRQIGPPAQVAGGTDLAARAAAIELDHAGLNVENAVSTINRFEADARHGEQGRRANALWRIGLLGNRGVQTPSWVFQALREGGKL